jgi:signal transduction histidine kinase
VLLSIALVVVTATAVAATVLQAVGRQVEQAADHRLVDGSALFRVLLEETRQDLQATGDWLSHDQELLAAVEGNRPEAIEERLAFGLQLHAVDEALIATDGGDVAVRRRVDGRSGPEGNIGGECGFQLALGGRTAYGIGRSDEGLLQQEVYVPIRFPGREQPGAVLRIASFLNQNDLDGFRSRTGLHISLFFGGDRVVTTLRGQDGLPLRQVGPEPSIYQAVVGDGRETFAWRDLPTGRVRSYYVPLDGPDNERVGMVSIAVPVSALEGDLRAVVLPVLPVGLGIVLVGGTLAYLLARRVRRPVLLLASAAADLGRGDLSTPIPAVAEPELRPLAERLEMARVAVKAHLETIASAEARLKAAFAALEEPIITTSVDGRVSSFNRRAAELFGGEERLRGRLLVELLPFVPSPEESRGRVTCQGQIVGPAGRSIDLEVHRARLADGQLPAVDVYVIHDVSHHADLNRFREQLLYNVAHELRGPLAVLENALEILSDEYGEMSTAEFDGLMQSSRRTVVRIRSLMEDLLSAGSIQAGRFQVRPEPISLSRVLDEALDLVGPTLEGRGQRVVLQPAGEDLRVLADVRYLRQVLSNLLSNASKYGPEGEEILVTTSRSDGRVLVGVRDEGPGIPPDQQAGLFERFYRLRTGSEQPGIGLGLAIAKGIVEAHGGQIGVESEVGAGTTVWFTIPAAPGVGE